MRMKAFGANWPAVLSVVYSGSFAARSGKCRAKTRPLARPPLTTWRRETRRETFVRSRMDCPLCLARCALDRLADTDVGAATPDVARHGGVDIDVVGVAIGCKQCGSRHDLSGLAIATLDDFEVEPSF